MTDSPVPFIRAILAGIADACGPFSDWLDEHGQCRDARLLRRRWAMYQRAVSDDGVKASQERLMVLFPDTPDTLGSIRQLMEDHIEAGFWAELHKNYEMACLKRYISRKFVKESRGRLT